MPKSGGKKLFVSKCGSKCGVKWKCGVKTLRRQNVASGTNVVAPPKWWKCGFKQCGVEMWRQAHIWWRLRKWPKCGVKQCGVRHKCGGSPKCGVKQCGVKMWRQAQMWWQSEMWRQTMWRQNVASDTPFAKLSSRKCVFKKGIQWQAQKCYTKCLCPAYLYISISWHRYHTVVRNAFYARILHYVLKNWVPDSGAAYLLLQLNLITWPRHQAWSCFSEVERLRYVHAHRGITISGEWQEDLQHGYGVRPQPMEEEWVSETWIH